MALTAYCCVGLNVSRVAFACVIQRIKRSERQWPASDARNLSICEACLTFSAAWVANEAHWIFVLARQASTRRAIQDCEMRRVACETICWAENTRPATCIARCTRCAIFKVSVSANTCVPDQVSCQKVTSCAI
jgi:hypothetical protein